MKQVQVDGGDRVRGNCENGGNEAMRHKRHPPNEANVMNASELQL